MVSNKKTAIYVRVSSQMQVDNGVSLDAQEQELVDFCLKNNKDYILYKDKGKSAKNINRTALQQLLEDVKSKKIDTVIVWKLSRLSRNVRDFANLLYLFQQNDVAFISYNEKINTAEASGKLLMYVLSIVAEIERDNISEYMTLAKKYVYESENRHMFSHVLGYNIKNKKVVVNQQEKELVNKIFNIYLSCKSLNETARQLDKEGYRGKNGGRFTARAVKNILTNKTYLGINKLKDAEKMAFESIVDSDVFKKAEKLLIK